MGNQDKNPQNGVQGSSYIYNFGTSPNTRAAVSQKVRVLAPVYGNNQALWQMGVLSNFNPTMNRTIDELRGIGQGDKIAELVPSITSAPTASVERGLLYLCNLWQSTGYASGVDGPVRSLAHHKWPFDVEQQVVFSTLVDADLGAPNVGVPGSPGSFDGGIQQLKYGVVTPDGLNFGNDAAQGHSAIVTMYEACWWNSWSTSGFTKDAGLITESGDMTITDVHDFASMYGEFLATGNDPTIGQLGSIRFASAMSNGYPTAGGGTVGAGATSLVVNG